jgi:hypothetical protein
MNALLERLRAEFVQMPGLRLKREQVQRLCGIDHVMCQPVLDALVDERFLSRKPDGTYARLSDGESSWRQPAKADMGGPWAKAS